MGLEREPFKFISEEAVGRRKQRYKSDDQMKLTQFPFTDDEGAGAAQRSSYSRMQSKVLSKSLETTMIFSAKEQVRNYFNFLVFVIGCKGTWEA